MLFLAAITLLALTVSFLFDRRKTFSALKSTVKKLGNLLPPLIWVLVVMSVVLYLLPGNRIGDLLGNGGTWAAGIIALAVGSISMLPGFIAFPLGGVLLDSGVPVSVIAAFTSSLMMVGVLTFPVEQRYLGTRLAILRNVLSLGIAIAVALATGFFLGARS